MVGDRIKTIEKLLADIKLLYVEDNLGLCDNIQKLFERVSDNFIIANDGKEGYRKFLEHELKIVITDINMPKMNNVLYDTILSINKEENRRLLLNQPQNIFNYQNNIAVMMFEGNFILPNKRFLEFFGVDTLDEFNEKFNMDKLLLEHKEFLYSSDSESWYEHVIKSFGTLFHTKIENHKGIKRHPILKSRDVTDLNLMSLFDSGSANKDNITQDKMELIREFKKLNTTQ
ncbi:response regulator transcription factor [Sulfurimonas sp.]|uniref:response regulator transcription factor n=1 Tax=Sulfurimonas sp. TaxID=2022749 RepID=UPI0035618CBC